MPRLQLSGGAYQARSIIASAQRSLNLYAEPLPEVQGEPSRFAYYQMPGLTLSQTVGIGPIRGIRRASNGKTYMVSGSGVYVLNPTTLLGSIAAGTTLVSMMDNTLDLVIVDGTATGYSVHLASNVFSVINDPTGSFVGADRVDYLDTFLLFNKPGTPQFQSSDSLALTFDPLFFANKSAAPDPLISIAVAKREIWLLGRDTTEVFYNSGGADFPFQAQPGVFVQHGCAAKYSVATLDNAVFWLSQDASGHGLVLMGSGYQATRISTYAIENQIARYAKISDAEGYVFTLAGHQFYVLSFPTADQTWVFDLSTHQWCEWKWLDSNGAEHRHRTRCCALVGNQLIAGDWQNGNLYVIDPTAYQDNGQPIKWQRSFPHLIADGRRVFYTQFLADMEVGTAQATSPLGTFVLGGDPLGFPLDPLVSLDWSDNRGASFGNPLMQSFGSKLDGSLGATGEYLTSIQFQRMGLARDRVFRLTWSAPVQTALQGAWVTSKVGRS